MNFKGQFVGLFCNEDDFVSDTGKRTVFVNRQFVKTHPEVKKHFFIMDDYTIDDITSVISQNPLNPFKHIDRVDVFYSIHLRIQELTEKIDCQKDVEEVMTAIYPGIAINEIIAHNEIKVKKYLKYLHTIKNLKKI